MNSPRQLVGAVLLATAALAARPALAEPVPQAHEISAVLDVKMATHYRTTTLTTAQYTWMPSTLDRKDEVAPVLRRFVRHPSALWMRLGRSSSRSLETRTSAHAGGYLTLLGGRLFVTGEAGLQHTKVNQDDDPFTGDVHEIGYYAVPLELELGGRPLPLISLAAVYRARPVAWAMTAASGEQAQRSGGEQEFGGRITAATASDRLLVSALVAWASTDLQFEGFHPGPITGSGLHGEVSLTTQASRTLSLFVHAAGKREDWKNRRARDEESEFVGNDVDRTVWGFEVALGMVYWFRGQSGFDVRLTGGFERVPPFYYHRNKLDNDMPFGGLLLGVVSRW